MTMRTAIAPLSELTAQLAADRAALTAARAALTAAQEAYEKEISPYYFTAAQIAANSTAALPDLSQAERTAAVAAAEVKTRARAIMDATASEQPSLTPEEEANAGARAALIREDCETLDYPALHQAINRAVLAGDRPAMFLFWRYGRARISHIDTAPLDPTADRAKSAAAAAVASIAERLTTGKTKEAYTAALALLTAASELAEATQQRARAANPPRYSFVGENDASW